MDFLENKKLFFERLKPFYKGRGYSYIGGFTPAFVLRTDSYFLISSFSILTNAQKIYGGRLGLCIWSVEDVILEIGMPTNDLLEQKKKQKDFLITTGDRDGEIAFNGETELVHKELVFSYTDAIMSYILGNEDNVVKKYSYLPNILAEMDRLEAEGLTWHDRSSGVLSGSLDAYFRGLIISKLCNDIKFEKKLLKMNDKFNEPKCAEWLPYYEKLKERLKTLDPVYNI